MTNRDAYILKIDFRAPVWELPDTDNDSQEFLVALTVDEDGKWTEGLTTHTNPSYNYNNWYEESTKESEYKGMYHIGTDGKIRIEPGEYEITKIPVSRYKFVENTWKLDTDENSVYEGSNRTTIEKLTITVPATKTATVHYYDQVAYYDKFSQVDTNVNKFYQLNSTTKANKTIKGIRIADYHQVGTTGNEYDTNNIVIDNTTNPVTTTDKMTVPVIYMTIYKIMSDGSEVEMTLAEKQALTTTNFVVSYEYDSTSGDKESFGNTTNHESDDFSYNSSLDASENHTYPSIIVNNAQNYKNGVYTLKATYNGKFTTNFDIVFKRTSS